MKIDFDYLLQFVSNIILTYVGDDKADEQLEEFVDDVRALLSKWCA